MPELPEVEEVRRSLEPFILKREILAYHLYRPDFLTLFPTPSRPPKSNPLASILHHRFIRTYRHGKKLFCILDDNQTLLFHLGMTGNLAGIHLTSEQSPPPLLPHTHFVLNLGPTRTGKLSEVRFRDPRRFGGIWYYPSFDLALAHEVTGRMGPDALSLKPSDLDHWRQSRSGSSAARLKARLMGQKDVAGLGNIYVDESLFLTSLHPRQRVHRIPPDKITQLVANIHKILNRSISLGGTTLRDYSNAHHIEGEFKAQLQVYGRANQPCLHCQTPLRSILITNRTTVFCPKCQRVI